MNIKTLLLNFSLMLVAALITAVLVVVGMRYLDKKNDNAPSDALLSSAPKKENKNLQFVEIKNLVITLKSDGLKEHYLLLDLALTTYDDKQSKRSETLLPKIKGIAVDMLTSMNYSDVRNMSVMDLRAMMMARYQAAFKSIDVAIPFEDVTISKMVFQ